MVVYLDLVFLLNALADGLALYVTARLSALPVKRGRLLAAAGLGGTYGALCALPVLRSGAAFFPQIAAAAALVWIAFGRRRDFLRYFLLFFLLSCTMGGALLALGRLLQEYGALDTLRALNWKVFFLAGGLCYLLLSVVFRGGAKHAVEGQLRSGRVELGGRTAELTVLLDTGHTLTDGPTGRKVVTVWWEALEPLWTAEERAVLARLEGQGAVWCLQRLAGTSPGRFRLLPYRAVGVSAGTLLCFLADRVVLDGKEERGVTVALSPTPVSDGGGYTALWGGGGGEKKEGVHAA